MKIRAWHLGAVVVGGLALLAVSVLALLAASVAGAQPTRPLDAGEQKQLETLQKTVKGLDATAGTVAKTSAGQRRVLQALAKQFKVQDSVVAGLKGRKMGYGEIASVLALSQELMKKDKKLGQQQALDTIIARRQAGAGWGVIARDLGLKLGNVVTELKKVDKVMESAKLDKTAQLQLDKPEKMQRASR